MLHPRIVAHQEEPRVNSVQDCPDHVFQHGLLLAKALQEEAEELS